MKQIAIILFLFVCCNSLFAQERKDSCTLEISLLTCSPGVELFSIFGHTAIRVLDSTRGMDIVFNYGTFDDTDPLFYAHFTRGIMNYSLSAETFDNFMVEYQMEHRSVTAQILNLNCNEKVNLYEALRKNTLDENRIYQYRFHTDNCTTRAGKIIEANTASPFTYKNILPEPGPTFRDMIFEYLNPRHQYWSRFGIDLCLGMNLDVKPTNVQAIHFLPDYLFRGMDNAWNGTQPMVRGKQIIIHFPETAPENNLLTPMFVFTSLFVISLALYFSKRKKGLFIFDIVFFTVIGLCGLLITCLWLGRVDDVCRNNMNVIWALPTHLIAVFFLRRKESWIKYYFMFTAVLASILLIGFPWWPQRMDMAVPPLLCTIIFRGFSLFQNRKDAEKNII
jgi:hypothetical protein